MHEPPVRTWELGDDDFVWVPAAQATGRTIASAVAASLFDGLLALPLLDGPGTQATKCLIEASAHRMTSWRPQEADERFADDFVAVASSLESLNAGLIAVHGCDPMRWPAAILAYVTGRRLVVVPDAGAALQTAAASDYRSILFCTSINSMPSLYGALTPSFLRQASETGIDTGVVAVRSVAEGWAWLIRRLFKNKIYKNYKGIQLIGAASYANSGVARDLCLTEAEFSATDAVRLRTPHGVAILEFHSKETCGILSDTVLCGRALRGVSACSVDALVAPGCAVDGQCIWKDKARFPVSDLNAAHLIFITCSGLRLSNGVADPDYQLGFSAMGGFSRSLIAPIKFVYAPQNLHDAAYELAFGVAKLGVIASQLNAVLERSGLDESCFVLLGDPEDIATESASQTHHQPLSDHTASSTIAQQTRAAVSAYSSSHVARGCLAGPASFYANVAIGRSADCAGIARSAVETWARVDCERSFWLSTAYDAAEPHKHSLRDHLACRVCGNIASVYRRQSLQQTWMRVTEICERCGIVADLPDSPLHASLDAPVACKPGDLVQVRLTIEAPAYASMAASISIAHAHRFGWKTPLPLCQNFGGERMDWSVVLEVPARFPPLVHFLRGFVVLNREPIFLTRPLIVVASRASYSP
ncbi:hypothetical protein ACI6QG_14690 [Roseococcus sp. DSY-14]|uniref:hypothetical protein n=1 Tax=Roseococcus sp. DSY-14 TaxID=3369650 RepID=UPI00387B2964